MATKLFTFITSLVFLFFGISGMYDTLLSLPPARLRFFTMHSGHWGFLYGWLPVNPVHNVIYILLGGLGVLMSPILFYARLWAGGIFAIMLMFVLLGLLPFGFSDLWGWLPLFHWNVMLHAVIAMLAYYFAFIYPLDLERQRALAQQ